MAEARDARPDRELEALREEWAPEWCVWRSRDRDGKPNEWCATRHGDDGECSTTLIEPTAKELEDALSQRSGRKRGDD